jgi:hypothetical protein
LPRTVPKWRRHGLGDERQNSLTNDIFHQKYQWARVGQVGNGQNNCTVERKSNIKTSYEVQSSLTVEVVAATKLLPGSR